MRPMTPTPPNRPLRQWRVTITEDRDGNALVAALSWRTFPCEASHWDETRWFDVPASGCAPIVSQEALRAILGELAAEEWTLRRRPR